MLQLLRVVSRFLREIGDKEPLPKTYVPEINNIADIRHASVRKIMLSLCQKRGRNTDERTAIKAGNVALHKGVIYI